jgi:phospholipid/cholesterol/gamma-HCH transport system substrate-binding protein
MRKSATASVVASPVLIGAVTVLITIVAVFLAYNANNGLPFVPTYDVYAQLPGGENLVKGNEVRVGGFRVGVVDEIKPVTDPKSGKAVARIHMKLDKTVEPLSRDTTLFVRPRSALGLKYVEVTPGRSKQTWKSGATIPLSQSRAPTELDDVLNTFDKPTRDASQQSLQGYGDAFAGRGMSINGAIEGLRPFVTHLTPVMKNLANPDTQLDQFFLQIGRASAQVAPVADVQARLFGEMADTFGAIAHDPKALQDTIAKAPSTLDTSIASFRVQRPFLADFTDLSHRLRPAASELPVALPRINTTFKVGPPVLKRSVELNKQTKDVFASLDKLARRPTTLLALKDLRTTVGVFTPTIQYAAPYNTVCNFTNYFLTGLSGHIGRDVANGTAEAVLLRSGTKTQPGRLDSDEAARPADIPANRDAQTTMAMDGQFAQAFHGQPYGPAIDSAGSADCEVGQWGYIQGPIPAYGTPGGTPFQPADGNPNDPSWYQTRAGGSHIVGAPSTPGLAGPTGTGVPNIQAVK